MLGQCSARNLQISQERCAAHYTGCPFKLDWLTFCYKVSREVGLEEVLVLKGVVQLGVGHAAALKPAVEDLVYALQGRAPFLAGNGQVVDEVAVQICDLHTSIAKYMKVK